MGEPSIHYLVARANYSRDGLKVVGRGETLIVGVYHHWCYGRSVVRNMIRLVNTIRANVKWNEGESWGPDVYEMFSGHVSQPLERYQKLMEYAIGFDESGLYNKVYPLDKNASDPIRQAPSNGITVTDIRDLHNIKQCFAMTPGEGVRGAKRDFYLFTPREYMELTYKTDPDAYWKQIRQKNPTKKQKNQHALMVANTVRGIKLLSRQHAALNVQPLTKEGLYELWPNTIPTAHHRGRSTSTAVA